MALCSLLWQQKLRDEWMGRAKPLGHPTCWFLSSACHLPASPDGVGHQVWQTSGLGTGLAGLVQTPGLFSVPRGWTSWWGDCHGKVFFSKTGLQVSGCCASITDWEKFGHKFKSQTAILSYLLVFGTQEGLEDVKPPQDDSVSITCKCLRTKWSLSHHKCALSIVCVIY